MTTSIETETAAVDSPRPEHDPVHHPSHYNNHPSGIECIEVTRLLGFDIGNAVKYVWRRGGKGKPVEDLEKSLFLLDDAQDNAPDNRHVPPTASELLRQVAAADTDPQASAFYLAVAEENWAAAENAVRALRAAL